MEKASKLTHRNKEICRQQNNQQSSGKINSALLVLCHRKKHAKCRSAIGDDIHDGDRVELHDQYFHGDFSEFFGFLIHFFIFEGICLINF